ncbi:uncharacterized protein EI97DRAFT_115660 [Westerdykella ornata]|uniref:Uncharacterized protein n=1 Tax=Westerdykella ornata TaxID=318751 RepID=A0A6A6JUH3_WESOR|nr:uncharacterized protein EI97DRAFT_115660 [Westerdykella ornata]KAF2280260.1 hypothetical protein EI97DRAFT_115660 [Westerdykella ornata]
MQNQSGPQISHSQVSRSFRFRYVSSSSVEGSDVTSSPSALQSSLNPSYDSSEDLCLIPANWCSKAPGKDSLETTESTRLGRNSAHSGLSCFLSGHSGANCFLSGHSTFSFFLPRIVGRRASRFAFCMLLAAKATKRCISSLEGCATQHSGYLSTIRPSSSTATRARSNASPFAHWPFSIRISRSSTTITPAKNLV